LVGAMTIGQMDQPQVAGVAVDQGGHRRLAHRPNDQIPFRKTERGPGEPGVAEIALRLCRLLGMFARLSWGAPGC